MVEEVRKRGRPKLNKNEVSSELKKIEEHFDSHEQQVKSMTMDKMNEAPKQELEPQTKLSSREIEKLPDFYLKPKRKIGDNQQFNEKFRKQWNYEKEYVQFIAEHKELIGETIEIWTHPYGGVGAEYWEVPTNKPVWGPRYLAEQIKRKFYHRLVMKQNVITESNGYGQMYGALAADTTIQRLDAMPVSTKKSIFMGANNF